VRAYVLVSQRLPIAYSMALKQLCRIQPKVAGIAPAEPAEVLLDAVLGVVVAMGRLIEPVVKQPLELEAGAAPVDDDVDVRVSGAILVPEVASITPYRDDASRKQSARRSAFAESLQPFKEDLLAWCHVFFGTTSSIHLGIE